jgi:O-antigen/teichoic acid export membrane protein
MINRFQHWLKNEVFQRLLKNAGILLTGNAISSALLFINFAVTARALGPELFGILVTIQTYVLIIDRLITFQSWQAIIKYGSEAIKENQWKDFQALIKFGILLDLSTAALGTVLALLGVRYLSRWQGWDPAIAKLAYTYSFLILFNLSGIGIAVLRIFDRFKLCTIPQIVTQAIRLGAVTIAFIMHASLPIFLYLWLATDVLAYALLFITGWQELQRRQLTAGLAAQPVLPIIKKYRGIRGFVISTNFIASIRLCSRELDILIIGSVLGNAAAGMFKVAKQFANIIVKISDPLYEAIYPEFAKLSAQQNMKEFRRILIRSAFMAGMGAMVFWAGFALLGRWLLQITVGPEYLPIYFPAVLYTIAIVIAVATFPLSPAVLALGKYTFLLNSLIVATLGYFLSLFFLLPKLDLIGASLAYIIYYIIWSLFMIGLLAPILRSK